MSQPSDGKVPSSPDYFDELDLEAALGALAGNPTDDAAAVLEVLPGPRALPLGPLVAAAAAAGIAAGWFLSTITPQVEPDIPIPTVVSAKLDNPLVQQIVGKAWHIDANEKEHPLSPGMRIDLEMKIRTGKKSILFLHLPSSGTELRVHGNTEFIIDRPSVTRLLTGTLWLQVPDGNRFLLETGEGSLTTNGGVFAVEATRSTLLANTYSGEMLFTGISDDEIPLPEGKACDSKDGYVSDSRKAIPPFHYLSWQAPLMLKAGRSSELLKFVYPLVKKLGDDETREFADRNLRLMGSIGAKALIDMLYDIDLNKVELRRRSSDLLLDIGDYASCGSWIPNLNDQDPTVRSNLVLMMERITGISSGGDREFWRKATQSERYDKIVLYRKKLEGFK